ncbi:MAG: M23 family metallopeptidase [Firmicutes bacterium]|nr:M23 family metallopeptidase [Bacillota bacterium]
MFANDIFKRFQDRIKAFGRRFQSQFQLRSFLIILLMGALLIVGHWIGRNSSPVVETEQPETKVDLSLEIAEVVRNELQRLLDTEYSWIVERSVLSTKVTPPEPERPNPTVHRNDYLENEVTEPEVEEVLSISFEKILWPANAEIVTVFGWQRHPVFNDWRFHGGIELFADSNKDVRTVLPGRVKSLETTSDGIELVIEHGSGWDTVYRAVENVNVNVGDKVNQNQVIAKVGSNSKFFFALHHENTPVDPTRYMN